jgi:copper chaperone CopZ
MNKVHYDVNGLQNTQMKTQVKNALDKLDGVRTINVDLDRGSIEVGFNQKTDENSIKNCIEHVGCKIT